MALGLYWAYKKWKEYKAKKQAELVGNKALIQETKVFADQDHKFPGAHRTKPGTVYSPGFLRSELISDINNALKIYDGDKNKAFESVARAKNVEVKSIREFWVGKDNLSYHHTHYYTMDRHNDLVFLRKSRTKKPEITKAKATYGSAPRDTTPKKKPSETSSSAADRRVIIEEVTKAAEKSGEPITPEIAEKVADKVTEQTSRRGTGFQGGGDGVHSKKGMKPGTTKEDWGAIGKPKADNNNGTNFGSLIALALVSYGLYKTARYIFKGDSKRRYNRRYYYDDNDDD